VRTPDFKDLERVSRSAMSEMGSPPAVAKERHLLMWLNESREIDVPILGHFAEIGFEIVLSDSVLYVVVRCQVVRGKTLAKPKIS
jgi:hypothetical protein